MEQLINSPNNPHILPHQVQAFKTLEAIAKVTFLTNRTQFPLQLRTNVCVVGPSGVGKTHLARKIGEGVPTYYVNIATWSLLGSSQRGAAHTWLCIFEFLEKCAGKHGAVIIVDEIDKVGMNDTSGYTTFLRSEVFDLLDWRIPRGLTDTEDEIIGENRLAAAEDFLRSKTMIIGVGAFQHFWESQDRASMGFLPEQSRLQLPDCNVIAETLPRELANRFGSNIISIPSLVREDYLQILDSIVDRMPELWRERFSDLARAKLDEAVRLKLGTRFFEEILLMTLVQQRQEIADFRPEPSMLKPIAPVPELDCGGGMAIF